MSAGYERREKQTGGRRKPARAVHGPGYEPTLDDMVVWLRRELAGRCVVELRMVGAPGCAAIIMHVPAEARTGWMFDQQALGLPALEDVVLAKKALVALAKRPG